MENCEDHVKVETRQKVREFCNQLLESLCNERPPIYVLATLVDVNKADKIDTANTVKVNFLKNRSTVCPIKVETLSKFNKSFLGPLFALFSMNLTVLASTIAYSSIIESHIADRSKHNYFYLEM